LAAVELVANPNEKLMTATAAMCRATSIRMVTPQGSFAVNPHVRMSFAFFTIFDSQSSVYRRQPVRR
jgi:hypothetical protein